MKNAGPTSARRRNVFQERMCEEKAIDRAAKLGGALMYKMFCGELGISPGDNAFARNGLTALSSGSAFKMNLIINDHRSSHYAEWMLVMNCASPSINCIN